MAKCENDPKNPAPYSDSYQRLCHFIDQALDIYRHELAMLIYPVFVQMYLDLVANEHEKEAIELMEKYTAYQEDYYLNDIRKLAVVTKKEQMKGNELIENFRSTQNQFTIRLSRDSYYYLKRFLNEVENSTVNNIIQERICIDIYEGITRSKKQVEYCTGGMMGEPKKAANKAKVFYGLLKEPELNIQVTADDDLDDSTMDNNPDGSERPKKKKLKKEYLSKKSRNDPNAPSLTRIPLPELRDVDKVEKINALRESAKRLKLSPSSLPSICFYTLLNSSPNQNMAALCVDISEDSNYIAAGFSNSIIKVWPLTPNKLRILRPSNQLEVIDKEADDVLARMMDDHVAYDKKVLYGHSGPVYSINFSPDKTLLISCSEDSTSRLEISRFTVSLHPTPVRLWSLQTWTNICCYKGHCFPVWDVKFSLHGYYFASCGHDRTARLWATDNHQPLRLFSGHISDVDCLQFHPNSNYVATGSSDRTVRLWDVLNGQCVRYYTGHKSKIFVLQFTNCGKFLVSAGADKVVLFWHLGHGYLVAQLTGHHDTIYTMNFSRDSNILATAGNDDCINLWDASKLLEELDSEEVNISQFPVVKTNSNDLLLGSYRTKSTNILTLHFTRRNLLLASGVVH